MFRAIVILAMVGIGFLSHHKARSEEKIIASSGPTKVSLVELYSSESCSSCPPADKWISGLESHKDLWVKFVPVGFHVDYWNHLNWKDQLSSSKMTARQVAVSKTWPQPSVYTPAVVLSGTEWRGWRASPLERQLSTTSSKLGLQIVKSAQGQFRIQVSGQNSGVKYVVHIAKLGFGLSSKVTAGENSGKTLDHNFVVLDWQQQELISGSQTTPFKFEEKIKSAKKYAIVAWIEDSVKPIALQATGGYL